MFGPRAGPGLRRVQGDLGPRQQDEPAQGGGPLPARREPPARPHLPTRRRSRRTSSSPTTRGASPTRPSGASGIGECRKEENGTMCPSYMVTKEEMHSTRGRAHLLFEMLQGDPMKGGWKSETGPRGARPLPGLQGMPHRVPDERRHGHVQGRVPRRTTTRGGCGPGTPTRWAGSTGGPGSPRWRRGWSTSLTHAPVVGKLFQMLGGISTRRKMPSFAPETFKAWWRRRPPRNLGRPRVVLWPDTFNNHFHPQTAKAAVEVLEDAGFQVIVPRQVALLRPAALRLRHARHGQGTAPRDPRHAAAGDRGGHAGRRPGAELRGRLPRRADATSFPMDEDAKRLSGQHVHPQRVPREEGPALPAAAAASARPWCRSTATTSTS